MTIDWFAKLRHLLQTLAFCLAVPAVQYVLQPSSSYEVGVRYSLCIGILMWALIDFGRHLFPSSVVTGWPAGFSAVALPMGSAVIAFLGGTVLAGQWSGQSLWTLTDWPQLRIAIGITVLAGTAAAAYFYNATRNAWLQERVREINRQATQAQLSLLQAQLEPHMLFNTLANLRVLIGTDPQRAQDMLDRMVDYLRATLTASRSPEHALEHEFERLADYLALMAVRMGERLSYAVELPDALRQARVPPLLLQPLVENAIRHGLEPQVEGGHITVRASRVAGSDGPLLVLEVTDTGVGLALGPEGSESPAPPAAAPGHRFGLTQVRERLATLYGTKGTLDLIALPQGGISARVTFDLYFDARI